MDEIIDKLLLLGLGIFLLYGREQTVLSVTAWLLAVIFAAFGFYFQNRKVFYVLFAGLCVLAVFFPMVLLFFPVFLYDALRVKLYWVIGAGAVLCMFYPVSGDLRDWILWGMTLVLSVVLQYKTQRKIFYQEELIRIRDSSTELNLVLEEKNRSLMEKQDYEIYSATLRERNRIAREIHDNVGHMLSRSLLQIGALLTLEKEGMVHEQLESMKETLNQAMNSIRESVHDLHDDSLDLRQAVEEALKVLREDYEVTFDYDMSDHIPGRVKYCFAATVKEAVSNIIKHSNGDSVQIMFREHPGFYQLSIQDNGTVNQVDFDNGIGLKNMKDRVDTLHGTFRIRTDSGFLIFISIQKTEEVLCER